jgi:hypothetical protein
MLNDGHEEIQVVEVPNGLFYAKPIYGVSGMTRDSRLDALRALEGELYRLIWEIQDKMAAEEEKDANR